MKWFFILLLFLPVTLPAVAKAENFDYSAFGQIPVQDGGRLKPLDSLARVMLKRIHGGATYEGLSASRWLAGMFFEPQEAMHAPIFTISSAQAVQMLGLSGHPDHLYSFEELADSLQAHAAFFASLTQKDKTALTRDETEVARIYSAASDFAELIGTFSLLLPVNNAEDARASLHLPEAAPVTYFDLQKKRQALDGAVKDMVKRKGDKLDTYTPEEAGLAQIAMRLSVQETLYQNNALVRVIPPSWGAEEWLSPWGVLKASSGSPQSAALLREWRTVAYAYRAKDAKGWNETLQTLLAASSSAITPFEAWRLWLEYIYNGLGLLPLAVGCYALGIIGVAACMKERFRPKLVLGKAVLLLGLALHATALAMRMLILMRPPVSTLYESLLFVSFVVMAASNWLGWRRHNYSGLLAGALTALMLLLASSVFAGDSDTLGVLVAVLNTNFWLATHVVCITTGYGCALVTGAIAHLYLFRRAVGRASESDLAPLGTLLHRAAIIALLFTSIGTMLGGIWADQSWGRFWGWDPKENGALLIVLWLIWLLHGRIAKQLGAFSFAACAALVNVVVAVAWIGVNLLSVGLHSYGFTDAAATGLLSFCAAEFLFVAAMALMHRFSVRKKAATASI